LIGLVPCVALAVSAVALVVALVGMEVVGSVGC